jgi:hypothetical protein
MTVSFGNFTKATRVKLSNDLQSESINDFITLFCHYYPRHRKYVSLSANDPYRKILFKREFIIKEEHDLQNDRKYLTVTKAKVKKFFNSLFKRAIEDKSFDDDKFDKSKFLIERVGANGKPLKPKLNTDQIKLYVDELSSLSEMPVYSEEALKVNKDDAAESLVCLALYYVSQNTSFSVSSFQDFIEYDLPSSISQVDLPFSLDNLKPYCSSEDPFLSWAVSSLIMAEKIKNSPSVSNISTLSNYTFCHSKSTTGKKYKYDIFRNEIELPSGIRVGEDKVQPADIFLVKTNYISNLSPAISESDPVAMVFDKLERFYNQNYKNGVLIPVSLKKTVYKTTTQKTTTQIKAVNYNPQGVKNEILTPRLLSDFIMRELLIVKNRNINEQSFIKWFDNFLEIDPINYRNYTDQVSTRITFKGTTYNNKRASPIYFDLTTPSSTYNFQRVGGNSWTGGVGFQVISRIIRTEPKIRQQFNKAVGHLLVMKKRYYMKTFNKSDWNTMHEILKNDFSSLREWQSVSKKLIDAHGSRALLFLFNYMKYISSKNIPYTNDLTKVMNSLGVSETRLRMIARKQNTQTKLEGYIAKGKQLTGDFGADINSLNTKLLGQKLADYEAFYIFSQIQNIVTEHFKKQYMLLVFSMCTGRGGVLANYDEMNKTTYDYLAGTRPMTHLLVGD